MKKEDVLNLLKENARMSNAAIAERLGAGEKEVALAIAEMEKCGLIKGYNAIVDETLMPGSVVKAMIEVKIRPEREGGFDRIAVRIAKFPEVSSVYLISGRYDLGVEIEGKTLQEVALFVSKRLSSIDGVISTETHFLLKKYKIAGRILEGEDEYERLKISP